MRIKELFYPNFEKLKKKKKITKLVRYLSSNRNEKIRIAAINALGKIGENVPLDQLISLINDNETYDVRHEAIRALGKIGDVRSLSFLEKEFKRFWSITVAEAINMIGFENTSDSIKASCLARMYKFDEAFKMGEEAIKPLATVIEKSIQFHVDYSEQVKVVKLLGKFGNPAIVELKNILVNPRLDHLTHFAAEALAEIGTSEATYALIDIVKKEKNYRSGEIAEKALMKNVTSDSIKALIANLNDEDPYIVNKFTDMIAECNDNRAIKPLLNNLFHKDEYVRRNTARTLCYHNKIDSVDEEMTILLTSAIAQEKNEATWKYILGSIGKIQNDKLFDSLIKVLESGKGKSSVIETLGNLGDTRAIDYLLNLLTYQSHSYEIQIIVTSLEKLGWKPDQSKESAIYWIEKTNWEKCIEIGENATEPLIQKLLITFPSAEEIELMKIANAIERINWTPSSDQVGAAYWIAKKEWEKCISLGTPAVAFAYDVFNTKDYSPNWNDKLTSLINNIIQQKAGSKVGFDTDLYEIILKNIFQYRNNWTIIPSNMAILFGDYAPIIDSIVSLNEKVTSGNGLDYNYINWEYPLTICDQYLDILCDIYSKVANNLLFQISKMSNAKVRTHHMIYDDELVGETTLGEVSFEEQRKRAISELNKRGNPDYNPNSYLGQNAWKIIRTTSMDRSRK
ncbi:MAG TPA: HEAT repeat domain-containing protein [Desulfobacteraceae bacterium]|nr:HEAT repeat domain-containing protein [Desulfobacteraceae bacterium]HPQ27035.1 HEAT repeat domain-containing protein [Desulfobacteraceae bacterium]